MIIKLLSYTNLPVEEQLRIEEDLLRNSKENYCLINNGTPEKTIVMGLSSKKEEMVHLDLIERDQIKVIQRFSGGGTVIVDKDTLFVTFIFNNDAHPFDPYPKPIMEWTASFYQRALNLPSFALRDNDYALGDLKIGGNAQYIKKDRWLHHTSFLYDFNPQNMDYLKHPKKQPKYRQDRSHNEFLTSLEPYIQRDQIIKQIQREIDLFTKELQSH